MIQDVANSDDEVCVLQGCLAACKLLVKVREWNIFTLFPLAQAVPFIRVVESENVKKNSSGQGFSRPPQFCIKRILAKIAVFSEDTVH